jgi:hypothetical protein
MPDRAANLDIVVKQDQRNTVPWPKPEFLLSRIGRGLQMHGLPMIL